MDNEASDGRHVAARASRWPRLAPARRRAVALAVFLIVAFVGDVPLTGVPLRDAVRTSLGLLALLAVVLIALAVYERRQRRRA